MTFKSLISLQICSMVVFICEKSTFPTNFYEINFFFIRTNFYVNVFRKWAIDSISHNLGQSPLPLSLLLIWPSWNPESGPHNIRRSVTTFLQPKVGVETRLLRIFWFIPQLWKSCMILITRNWPNDILQYCFLDCCKKLQ